MSALYAPLAGATALAGATNGVWALISGQWQREEGGPAGVMALASEPNGIPWALAPDGVWRRDTSWQRVHTIEDDVLAHPYGLLPQGSNEVLVAAETGLFALAGKRRYWLKLEVRPGGLLSSRARAVAWLDADHFLVATDKGLNLSNGTRGWAPLTGAEGLPILDLTHIAAAADGTVWFGSEEGVIRWKSGRWTYLAGKRWLPDDRVTALAPALDGSAWAGTAKGLAHLYYRKLTLADKAALLQVDLESRDRRHGYVTQMHLRAPGVVEGALQEVSDNDGLWTGLYIASQSYRYAVTKAPEAKAQAWRSMQALLRLESLTGIPGFPARAVCRTNEPQFGSRSLRSDPEWHPSPIEPGWYWKGETSSDEIDGHYLAWQVFYDLAADEEQKRQVRATCKRVTDHILDHHYYLVDVDGQPTTWGFWGPDRLNDDPKYWEERGLGSLEMLSHLKVAIHVVGEPRYERAYQELIREHHYALNTIPAKHPGGVSHDNQLLFLAYYPLLQLEKGPGLRAIYTESLKRSWDALRADASPLWNFIYGACTGQPCDVEAAVEALREMPLDFIQWRMRNSHRADLDPSHRRPLPWAERVIHNWDASPYHHDSGSDRSEADQTVWLLPYWMGRFHGLIE
ncbi:MAG: hypothetical protein DME25_15525 [Verrucomicrobia bacterium]|nr:MAG: hypothetical protein DME25_15525 [Verrucomicrobiota bacterium]